MRTIVRLVVLAAVFDLLNSSHLHSRLNSQKKGKKIDSSVDDSNGDASGIGIGGDSDFNKTLDNVQRNGILNGVRGMKQKMEGAVEQIGIVANSMVKKKSGLDVAGQMMKARTQARKFTLSASSTRKLGKGLAGVEAMSTGVVTLVKGIQAGDWINMVSGGLAIAASIAAFMGPVGVLFSVGFSILSAIFGMFGGATGGEESTEDMTKRLLKDALLEDTSENLRAEASGLKRLYGTLSKTTANLRKADKVTCGQAVEFYNQAFVGVKLFGILEFYIDKWCKIGDYQHSKKEEINKNANRCLEFVNLYCDLAILRQMLVSDMASFLVEKGLEETARNILGLVAEEQRSDMQFLRFIFDPINHRRQRYVAGKYWAAMEKYTTLTDYLKKLDDISMMETEEDVEPVEGEPLTSISTNQTPRKLLKEFVIYCTGNNLQTDCYQNSGLGTFDKSMKEFKNMENKIKSLYITASRHVRIYLVDARVDFTGPGVYNMIDGNVKIKSIEILHHDQIKMVKVCEKENMEMDGDNHFSCTAFEIGTGWDLRYAPAWQYADDDFRMFGQLTKWINRITSLSIPPMLEITGKDGDKTYGPYYGPSVINKLPKPKTWKSLEIKESRYLTHNMVKICSEENLGGFCDHLIPPESVTATEDDFKMILLYSHHGTNWKDDIKPKSMKVPGGIRIHLFDDNDARYGPYKGPVTVTKTDGINHLLKVIKIERFF